MCLHCDFLSFFLRYGVLYRRCIEPKHLLKMFTEASELTNQPTRQKDICTRHTTDSYCLLYFSPVSLFRIECIACWFCCSTLRILLHHSASSIKHYTVSLLFVEPNVYIFVCMYGCWLALAHFLIIVPIQQWKLLVRMCVSTIRYRKRKSNFLL